VRPQIEALEHHAEGGADAIDLLPVLRHRVGVLGRPHADQLAADIDLAGIRRLQEVDAAEQGRLARAGRADHGDHVAHIGLDRDPLQDLEIAEPLVQILDDQRFFRHSTPLTHALLIRRSGLSCPR
jgi:hypothetical protein